MATVARFIERCETCHGGGMVTGPAGIDICPDCAQNAEAIFRWVHDGGVPWGISHRTPKENCNFSQDEIS